MSKSYFMVMAGLLLIGLTSISSVAGLVAKCYFCFNDGDFAGPGSCKNSTMGERNCEPPFNQGCQQDNYLEDGKYYKKGEVNHRGCTNETMDGCRDTVFYQTKVKQCICLTDVCNDGKQAGQQSSPGSEANGHQPSGNSTGSNPTGESSGHHHHPLLLIAASVLTAVLVFLQPQIS